jgi:hypothetical protein
MRSIPHSSKDVFYVFVFVGELSWESRGRRELGGAKPHYGLWGDLGDLGEIVIFAISII